MASTQTLWAIRKAPPLYSLSKVATVTLSNCSFLQLVFFISRWTSTLSTCSCLLQSRKGLYDGERDALDGHEFLINHYANVLARLPQCQLFLNLNSNAGSGRSRLLTLISMTLNRMAEEASVTNSPLLQAAVTAVGAINLTGYTLHLLSHTNGDDKQLHGAERSRPSIFTVGIS